MIYAISVWLAFLAFTFLGPPVGSKPWGASNDATGVNIAARETIEKDGQCYEGVLAQEVAEFRLGWLTGLVAAFPLTFVSEYAAFFVGIGIPLGNLVGRIFTNGFDYVGHNVEIMVAEERGFVGYRMQEVQRMIRRDPSRTGMTIADVETKLHRWEWLARIMRRLV